MPAQASLTPAERRSRYTECDALAARMTELYAYLTAATYQFLCLVAEFDEKGYWELAGVHSTAHWLNWQCGIGMNAAREKVRVARSLKHLPKISRAFARGEISYSKVRAITRAADSKNEDYLLMFARHGTAYHVERLIAGYRRCKRLERTDEEREYRQGGDVEHWWDVDGCLIVKARLPADQGAMLMKAIDLAQDRQWEAMKESRDVKDRGWYAGEQSPHQAKPTRESRRANALAEVAEAYLGQEAPNGSTGDRYQVVVHVSAETPGEVPSDLPRIDRGTSVSTETSRRAACDSSIVPIFRGIRGEPLSVGRKTRSIPPPILRALWVRDRGCRFPGCTNDRYCDGHHIEHWANGGETSLENLVLLCRHHHRLVHEGGYGCEVNEYGSVVFKSPRGNVIPNAFRMTAPPSVNEPFDWIANEFDCDHIDPKTCVTRWLGEKCDWPLAVGHLFDP